MFTFVFQFSFDLQLEKWGVDVEILKEPAITRRFIGWTEDWEKEKFKDSGAVARAMFMNKYKDTIFYLPDTGETYHVDDGGIQFLRGQSGGWTIYGNSDKPGVEEESLTPFLVVQNTIKMKNVIFILDSSSGMPCIQGISNSWCRRQPRHFQNFPTFG